MQGVVQNKQQFFYELCDAVNGQLRGGEILNLYLRGESSDFCRFNAAKIRQGGHVQQDLVTIRLVDSGKSLESEITLSGDLTHDLSVVTTVLEDMRGDLGFLQSDPYLCVSEVDQGSDQNIRSSELRPSEEIISNILTQAAPFDLVGIYAAGEVYCGFASSTGQKNWFSTSSFNVDFSCYHSKDKAVKASYAGFKWDDQLFVRKLETVRQELDVVRFPAKVLKPGKYEAYLSPASVSELCDMLSWGGFSLNAYRKKNSPLVRLQSPNDKHAEMGMRFSKELQISENTAEGLAPHFDTFGFKKPKRVSMVKDGYLDQLLTSGRSAKEFKIQANAANLAESPEALEMGAGSLSREKILQQMDQGVWINNLWYLNFSDRPACRVTGMTRFASFYVENGEIKAPINVMRFDDSLYDLLGSKLKGLTQERDWQLSSDTYGRRSTSSQRLPGVLVSDLTFTL